MAGADLGRKVTGQILQHPVGAGRTWILTLSEAEMLQGHEQMRRTDSFWGGQTMGVKGRGHCSGPVSEDGSLVRVAEAKVVVVGEQEGSGGILKAELPGALTDWMLGCGKEGLRVRLLA